MTAKQLLQARKAYHVYCQEIDKYYNELSKTCDSDKQILIMQELYQYIKYISLILYNQDENFNKNYIALTSSTLLCEKLLPKEYIVDIKTNFNYNSIKMCKTEDPYAILEYIVNQARRYILSKARYDMNPVLENMNLMCHCIPTCNFIENICHDLNLKYQKIALNPGFTNDVNLFNGVKQHYFMIVKIRGVKYLIDCTYAQFFKLDRCLIDRLGIMKQSGCNPGVFMNLDSSRLRVAKQILKYGFIELTDDVLKAYLDGFAISYRNGLYYENTHDFTYTTDYTANNYRDFLNNEDNQLNHESKLLLGIQKQPLQNPKLSFSKR